MSLYSNPAIFLLIWKIFFFIILGLFAFLMILNLISEGPEGAFGILKIFLYFVIGMTVLTGVSYLIYAAIMGGKYCVMFEMDDNGINHKQMPKQAEKAELLSALTMMAGAASGSLSTVGLGMASAETEMYSEFVNVRELKAFPRSNLIKVNGRLQHNQVYADAEDFDFVYGFLSERCPNARKSRS